MERMGHSSITVTLGTYGHLLPGLDTELTTRLGAVIEAATTDPLLPVYCPAWTTRRCSRAKRPV